MPNNVKSRESRPEPLKRRNGLLFSLLGLLILVEVVTVVVVLAAQRFATDRALLEHTHELLRNVVNETRENAVAYLGQAQDSVTLAAGVFESGILDLDDQANMESFFLQQLRVVPQLDAIYFGAVNGDFVFSKRGKLGSNDAFVTKLIATAKPADQRVSLISRDRFLRAIATRTDPQDRFDPRTRPWYQQAADRPSAIWTDPYIFYTSRMPGLTVARAVRDRKDRLIGVIGADIELSQLSEFLKTQRIGQRGVAFIIYSNGDVIAHPDGQNLTQSADDETLRLKQLADLDPVTARAGERLRDRFPDLVALNHTFLDDFEVASERYISMFVPFLKRGQKLWIMGAFAPEEDMAPTVRKGQRESIQLGIAMAILSMTVALMLALLVFRPINTLQRQAREDPLTGLLNRRSFNEIAEKGIAGNARARHRLSVIMIDIDRFKMINDEFGHGVGDEVLTIVARRVNRSLSDDSILSRYGGEEFAILLPDSNLEQAVAIAERIREQVSSTPIKTSTITVDVTISLGVAELPAGDNTVSELLDLADQRLLLAKKRGRDRVVSADD